MIRDRFVTGHQDCDLRRHLDSVPPGTPIRDIVDICRVWESHADADDQSFVKAAPARTRSVYTVSEPAVMRAERVVAAVATPSVGLADLEMLLNRLLARMPAFVVTGTGVAASACNHGYGQDAAASAAAGNADAGPAVESSPGSQGLDYSGVFFLWQAGPQSQQVPAVGQNIPLHIAGMVGGKGGNQYMIILPRAAAERLQPGNDN